MPNPNRGPSVIRRVHNLVVGPRRALPEQRDGRLGVADRLRWGVKGRGSREEIVFGGSILLLNLDDRLRDRVGVVYRAGDVG